MTDTIWTAIRAQKRWRIEDETGDTVAFVESRHDAEPIAHLLAAAPAMHDGLIEIAAELERMALVHEGLLRGGLMQLAKMARERAFE